MYIVYFGNAKLYSHIFHSEAEAKKFAEAVWNTYDFVTVTVTKE
jgi:hypothetical protein